jgi:hypothetical protein
VNKFVLKRASVVIDDVDLSNAFSEITIETSKDDVDVTGFQSEYREILAGLGDASITGSVFQGFDAGGVDATLWPLYVAGEPFEIVVKPKDTAVAADNPSYTMQAVLLEYNPLDGAVGDASATDVTFRNATQEGLVRSITPGP